MVAVLLAGLVPSIAVATDSGAIAYGEGVLGPQKHETGLTSLGPDLFGEQINTNTGGISFSQTDLSLPGNNALPVSVTRRLIVDGNKSPSFDGDLNLWRGYPYGEWELDLPYMAGTYTAQNGWDVSTATPSARCSSPTSHNQFQPRDVEAVSDVWFYYFQFWNGLQLNVPGQGEQGLLYRPAGAPFSTPSSALLPANAVGGWTGLTTKDQWHFACLPTLQTGKTGEGFLALAPDGTRYWFNWMVSYANRPMHGHGFVDSGAGTTPHRVSADMDRRDYRLYPTRIEDRFGNYVSYSYASIPSDGLRITSISASDGRSISFGYNAGGQIASAAAGTQSVDYGYADGLLTTVTLPDGNTWGISNSAVVNLDRFGLQGTNLFDQTYECQWMRNLSGDTADLVMTHPSGAQGVFHLGYNRLFRTDLVNSLVDCGYYNNPDGIPETWRDHQPSARALRFDVLALQQKTLSGPGMTAQTWQLQHQDNFTLRPPTGGPSGDPINGTRTMTEVRPDGSKEVSVFGTDALVNEGQLLSHKVLASDGTVLTQQTNTYVQESEMASMPFPNWMGDPLHYEFIRGRGDYNRPLKQSVLQQQGVSFTSAVNTFDSQVRATKVTKSSTLGYSRTELTAYAVDNTTKWVLGLVAKVTCTAAAPAHAACDGQAADSIESETTYDPIYAVPTQTKAFGKVQKTMGYDTTSTIASGQRGTLHTVTDGNSHATTLSNWYRGIPKTIAFADTHGISATVDVNGWITSVKDENNYTTNYHYDLAGRLDKITYPTGDTPAWNDTTIAYAKVGPTTTEYGIPGGHWKRTESTGNSRKVTYYDAMWRPLVEEQYDTGNAAATRSLGVKRYDAMNHLAFQAYPVASLPNGYADAALKGTDTLYDALDRVTSVQQDSELGALTTTTAYLTGFKTQVSNPRTYKTTTSYMAYDQPTTDWPVSIQAADGRPVEEDTDIFRDPYGNPLTITRHNPDSSVSEQRTYTYNNNREVCRAVEPETGATLMGYDGAGNLAYSAAGLPSTTACNANGDTAAILARKVARGYDARNRLLHLTFPDGRGDQDWTYTADGLPDLITTYNGSAHTLSVKNDYAYNHRRLLVGESSQLGTSTALAIGYGYDGNGHLSSQVWPDGKTVQFQPNALGQVTRIDTGATNPVAWGATYYPNGALKSFVYGNGIVHTMTQNARQLPETSIDSDGTTAFLSDSYDYDANGNVQAITDGATGRNQRGNRDMAYDALDRLMYADSVMFGNTGATARVNYSHDALDNLVHVSMPATATNAARDWDYCYDQNWRLTNLKTGGCTGTSVVGLGYDAQGNLANKNGTAFDFDYGNRLRSATYNGATLESYQYDGYGRRVKSVAPSGTIQSIYSQGGQLLYQQNGRTGKNINYYYLAGSLVNEVEYDVASSTYANRYQHTDALGSPVLVTDGGRVQQGSRNEYEPYGQVLAGGIADRPGYTGHVADAQTGMDYMQQRYYDPMIGRFLSVDPVTALSNPVGMFNRYDYAYNSPYNFTDPDGRCPECLGAAVGAGSDLAIQGIFIAAGLQDHVDWKSVGISAGTGALGVGLVGKLGKVGELAADAAISVASKAIKGEDITVKGVLIDVAASQFGGKSVEAAVERRIVNSAEHKVAQRQANRLERIGRKPNARAAQVARAEEAQPSLNQSVAQRAAAAGVAGSNLASKTAEAADIGPLKEDK